MRLFARTAVVAAAALLTCALIQPAFASGHPPVANGVIAFRDGETGQVYTIEPDGSNLVQITHLGKRSFAADPMWSPDGAHIILAIYGRSGARVYQMNADGTDLTQVYKDKPGWYDVTPSYTPDGNTIVFSRCTESCAVYSVDVDGSDLNQLTPYRHGIHAGADFCPRVSADGTVAFARQGSDGILSRIWEMNLDGSNAHPVTKTSLEAGARLQWSSDGSRLFFTAPAARSFGSWLYSIAPDGSDVTQLTRTKYPNGDYDPAPSPDGQYVAFTTDRRYQNPVNVSDLFVMNSDGSGPRFVQTGLTLPLDPAWQPVPGA